MEKLYKMSEAAEILGVTVKTLQRWDRDEKIEINRTPGGRRRVPEREIERLKGEKGKRKERGGVRNVAYARVSSNDQKKRGDLDRQVGVLVGGIEGEVKRVYKDVGSGLNDSRSDLIKMMEDAKEGEITDIFITYKDRLTRFGYKYLEMYFNSHGVEIHVMKEDNDEKGDKEELVEDMISIVTSFSGKIYGKRGRKKALKKLEGRLRDEDVSDEDNVNG